MAGVVRAYVVAIVKRGKEYEAVEKVQKMEGVTEALITYGLFDLIIRIEAESLGHLYQIVADIRQIKEIEQTSTLVAA